MVGGPEANGLGMLRVTIGLARLRTAKATSFPLSLGLSSGSFVLGFRGSGGPSLVWPGASPCQQIQRMTKASVANGLETLNHPKPLNPKRNPINPKPR